MTQLARHFEEHPEVRYGITTMCIGIGMGGTVIWENPHWHDGGTGSDGRAGQHAADRVLPARSSPRPWSGIVDLPLGAGRLRADHPGQRARPHQAEHVRTRRPARAGRAPSTGSHAEPDVVGVGVTGKPFIFAVGADLRAWRW